MSSAAKKVRGQCDSSLWTKEKTFQLIKLLEANSELWDVSSPLYSNRTHKMNLQLDIAKILRVDVSEVVSKFHNLRCQYNAEIRKLKSRRSSGSDLNLPRWRFFNAMKFLSNCAQTRVPTSISKSLKSEDNTENQKPVNDTTLNVLKFIPPASLIESPTVNSNLSNLCQDSLHMISSEDFSDDHEENVETSSLSPMYNNNFHFESNEENCEKLLSANNPATIQVSESPDMWDMVGKFVAINGREWAKVNFKLSNQFKTAIYKLLADFQARAAEADNQDPIATNHIKNS